MSTETAAGSIPGYIVRDASGYLLSVQSWVPSADDLEPGDVITRATLVVAPGENPAEPLTRAIRAGQDRTPSGIAATLLAGKLS